MAQNTKYRRTVDWLFSQLPMYQRVGPAAVKKDLTNIRRLCEQLGEPQKLFPSIHIAGTNGKGSVAHMLAAALQAQGYKTGLYTSPHYRDFRERIKVNGHYIEASYVVDFVDAHRDLFLELQPSFFEITVAMAFACFAHEKVDIAVVETGLGGRLDSTNIIHPLVSVITNISYDHQQFLGDTLPEIAGEKAGIIKSRTPVVVGESQPEIEHVFRSRAVQMAAPLYIADRFYDARLRSEKEEGAVYDIYHREKVRYENLQLGLRGKYQRQNLQTVLQTLDCLRDDFPVSEENLREGLRDIRRLTNFIGRWQI
ncbi:MAG: Mur ligase family protein, partial [Saprospiraceae bacterium]|nr:Mur ligase family protein [Saprospiraceae bacterium]